MTDRDHLVISVHGIRTFGQWQERLEALLKSNAAGAEAGRIEVVNYKYGYFSAIAFLIPILRWIIVRRFRTTLSDQLARRPWRRVDIVAHSFGTHLIGWALLGLKDQKPRIDTVILAGSVLRSDFAWSDLIGTSIRRLINDCGTSDSVLLLSQFFVLFTGMAGRVGFSGMTGETLRNRFHLIGHSGYFLTAGRPDDSFMIQQWLPLLTTDAPAAPFEDPRSLGPLSGVTTWLTNNMEPVKLTIYVVPMLVFTAWIFLLYLSGEANRRLSDAARAASEASRDPGADATSETARRRLVSALSAARTVELLDAPSTDANHALAAAMTNWPRRVATFHTTSASLAFDPRLRFVVVGDGTKLHLVDVISGRTRATMTLPERIRAVAFDPEGKSVVVGTDLGSIIRVDLLTMRGRASAHRFKGGVESVTYSDDGDYVGAVGRDSGTAAIRIIDELDHLVASDAFEPGEAFEATSPLPHIKFSGQQAVAVVTVPDAWTRAGAHVLALSGPERKYFSRSPEDAFLHEGDLVVVGYDGAGLTRYRNGLQEDVIYLNDAISRFPWGWTSSTPSGLAVSPDGDLLAAYGDLSLDRDRFSEQIEWLAVRLYSTRDGRLLAELPQISVTALAFSRDSARLAIAVGKSVSIHRATDGQFEANVEVDQPVAKIALSHDGQTLCTIGGDGTLNVWSMADAREILRVEGRGSAPTLVLSDDEQYLAKYSAGEPLSIWSTVDGVLRASFAPLGTVLETRFVSNELAVISAADSDFLRGGSTLALIDGSTGTQTLLKPTDEIFSRIAFDEKHTVLAVGTYSGKVFLWRRKDSKWLGPSVQHLADGVISSLAISPDGTFIAAGSGQLLRWQAPKHDATLRVCTLGLLSTPSKACHLVTKIDGGVNDVAFDSHGRTLAVASGKAAVFMYDHRARSLLRTFTHDGEYVQQVRFTDGNRSLVTTSAALRSAPGYGDYADAESVDLWRVADGRHLDHRGYERARTPSVWNIDRPVLYRTAISDGGTVSALVFRNLRERKSSANAPTYPDAVMWRADDERFSESYRDRGFPRDAAFAAGRTRIGTIDPASKTVHLLNVDAKRLFEVACAATRNEPGACTAELTIRDILHRGAARGPSTATKMVWLTTSTFFGQVAPRLSDVALVGVMFLLLLVTARRWSSALPVLRIAIIGCFGIAFVTGAIRLYNRSGPVSNVPPPKVDSASMFTPETVRVEVAAAVPPPTLSKAAQREVRFRALDIVSRETPFRRDPNENPYAAEKVIAALEKEFGIEFGDAQIPDKLDDFLNLILRLKLEQTPGR